MRERDGLSAGGLRRGLLESGELVATCVETLEHELRDSPQGRPILTRDNPYLEQDEVSVLDAEGLIREGAVVHDGIVLAGILQPTSAKTGKDVIVVDASWRLPFGWDGATVISARRESSAGRRHEFRRGVLERLNVTLERKVPFAITDALTWKQQRLDTRYLVDDDRLPLDVNRQRADLVVSHAVADALELGPEEVRSIEVARRELPTVDALRVCAKGNYSLITMKPMMFPNRRHQGELITAKQFAWLAEHGYRGLLSEFASLKSDDLENRGRLNAFADGAGDIRGLSTAAPESLFVLTAYLTGLGLSVATRSGSRGVELSLRPAASEDVLRISNGRVRRPETIQCETYKPTPGGIFCETVFGEEGSTDRRRRFGHFELAEPIVPVIWRLPPQNVLATLLDITPRNLNRIVRRDVEVHAVNGRFEVRKIALSTIEGALTGNSNDDSCLGTGTGAIRRMLAMLPDGRIPAVFGAQGERFFLKNLVLIPADYRPLVLLDSGCFATSDVNDLYRQVINRSNRLSKLIELKAPPVIIHKEIWMLQSSVDTLHANHLVGSPVRGSSGDPLVSLVGMLSGLLGRPGKAVEWCGQARALADGAIQCGRIGVPGMIFDELRLAESQPILLSCKLVGFIARYPVRIEDFLIHFHPDDAEFLHQGEICVTVHRPLTAAGIDEAVAIASNAHIHAVPRSEDADFLRHDDEPSMLRDLIDLAVRGTYVAMTSLRATVICGTGAINSDLTSVQQRKQVEYRIHIPKREPIPLPSMEQIDVAIQRRGRKGCLFHIERADREPNPSEGRIGGLPWMPNGSLWPMLRTDEPMEFVGQFPLDPARQAGALPFDVPAGSLLTVFWNSEWDTSGCTDDGAITIHSSENLVRLDPPNTDYNVLPMCAIRPAIREIFPSLEEMLEILEWELDISLKQKLKKLLAGHGERYFNPDDLSRIGGYPHWVQYPEPIEFVAQITSNDRITPLSFGDGGSLYIHGKDPENLASFIQCY